MREDRKRKILNERERERKDRKIERVRECEREEEREIFG